MAAPAFRSKNSANYASRTATTTVTKPTGTASGDVLLAISAIARTVGDSENITGSTGWTAVGAETAVHDGTNTEIGLRMWWLRAGGSEPSSYSFDTSLGATRNTEVAIAAYSGCIASGNPIDVYSTNSGTGTSATALSITTTVADTLLVIGDQNWDAANAHVPPGGFTERNEFLTTLNDAAQTSAGASGNKGPYTSGTTGGSNPWQAWMLALKPVASSTPVTVNLTGLDLTAAVGTATVVGKANVSPTGLGATSAVGTATVTLSITAVGLDLTASVGTVSVTAFASASVSLTGLGLTAAVGTAVGAIPITNAWDSSLVTSGIVLSNSDKTGTAPAGVTGNLWSTTEHATGHYYAEVALTVATPTGRVGVYCGPLVDGAFLLANGSVEIDRDGGVERTYTGVFPALATNDIVGIALDADIGRVWFRVNGGNWNNDSSQNPFANISVSFVSPAALAISNGSTTVVGKANVSVTGLGLTSSVGTASVTTAGGYDNLNNWPSAANRPAFSGSTLSWTGPVGGGASTSADTAQTATLTTNSGSFSTSSNNQVITNTNFTGDVHVNHTGVTFRACRFQCGSWAAVDITAINCRIEDCLLVSNGTNYQGISRSSNYAIPSGCIIRRCNLTGYENLVTTGTSLTVIDCWLHASIGPDQDMVELYGGTDTVAITHCTFDGRDKVSGFLNSGINVTNYGGTVLNVTVTNCCFVHVGNYFAICNDNNQGGGTVTWSIVNSGFYDNVDYKRAASPAPSPNTGNFNMASASATTGSLVNGTGAI